MKKLLLLTVLALTALCTFARNRAEEIIDIINGPKSDYVLVASHRGDWRNYPENSLAAMNSAIKMGVDIIELDLAMTRDSVLVVCHDRTIDRTTTGKGLIKDLTLDSIKNVYLKTGHGIATKHRMPTLREALEVCRDRAVVNIDKGWQYYDRVIALTDSMGVTGQMLIKGTKPLEKVRRKMNQYPGKMIYFAIVDYTKKNAPEIAGSYLKSKITPAAYEVVWPEYTPEVQNTIKQFLGRGAKLWVNALWPSHNAGLCDDAAFEGDPAQIYGELLKTGASMVQSDRPALLLDYLRSVGRHK